MKKLINRIKISTTRKATHCPRCGQPIEKYDERYYLGENMLGERTYVCSEECFRFIHSTNA